jgi:penicillin amidase
MSVSLTKRLVFTALAMLVPLFIGICAYVGYVWIGAASGTARTSGTIAGLGLHAPVRVIRDGRGVPHIRAASIHDAAFAQGYVTGADRLFQIDITRRFVLGTLAEMFGSSVIDADQDARVVDIRGIADAEYAHLSAGDRDMLQAYADGVNAAAANESLPPEYRGLLYHFVPWRPQDSVAVGFAVVLDLADSWNDVMARDAVERELGPRATAAFFSLTDPAYDVPTAGGRPVTLPPLPALDGARAPVTVSWDGQSTHDVLGSNEWVAGLGRTSTGRALLANDPHLVRRLPGIWHLVDIAAPGEHVAGAAIAGVPGVILGHNEHLAWGATNADVVSPRVYRETFATDDGRRYKAGSKWVDAVVRTETFNDRFGSPRKHTYLATRHGFVLEISGTVRHAVQWAPITDTRSPIEAYLALDRAATIEAGLRALATYPGPSQNFTLAQTDGRAAYTLAGAIPDDPGWGLLAGNGAALPAQPLTFVPFAHLPHVAASRATLAISANNLPYGTGYPYRLSAYFGAPYRAAEITRHLHALPAVDVAASQIVQADTTSPAEREFAHLCAAALKKSGADRDPDIAPSYAALASFDGRFDPSSRGATVIQRVRFVATRDLIASHMTATAAMNYLRDGPAFVTLMRALRERPRGWFPHDDPDAYLVAAVRSTVTLFGGRDRVDTPYGTAYAVVTQHPFSVFHIHFWDAPSFPGSGGSYAPAVQAIALAQSFRAVWDVGAWDAGGIDLPLGESGEPGSPHYTDAVAPWLRHDLTPLPFSDAAVARAATGTLTLTP